MIKVRKKGYCMKQSTSKRPVHTPKFHSEDEERKFWATHDFTDYLHQFKPVTLDMSGLKPSTVPVTVRLPVALVDDLKRLANKRDIPYQSLMKVYLSERVKTEFA